MKKIAGAMAVLVLGSGFLMAPEAKAATPQIVDPALDHPVPWADLVGVEVSVVKNRSRDFLQVVFSTSGDISDPTRNTLTGYNFSAKVGSCELLVGFNAFPMVTEPAGLPPGSAGAQCGANGKELGGTFKLKGTTVTVQVPMQDLVGKGVVRGATMANLKAHTALLQGLSGDDTGALELAGDAASSAKTYTLA